MPHPITSNDIVVDLISSGKLDVRKAIAFNPIVLEELALDTIGEMKILVNINGHCNIPTHPYS